MTISNSTLARSTQNPNSVIPFNQNQNVVFNSILNLETPFNQNIGIFI
jgi:hypothetical protein